MFVLRLFPSRRNIVSTRISTFFFLLFSMEGNRTSVIESSDGDIKKLMASAVPESTKKSLKYAVNVFEGGESHE